MKKIFFLIGCISSSLNCFSITKKLRVLSSMSNFAWQFSYWWNQRRAILPQTQICKFGTTKFDTHTVLLCDKVLISLFLLQVLLSSWHSERQVQFYFPRNLAFHLHVAKNFFNNFFVTWPELACSSHSDSRAWRSVGSELNCTPGKTDGREKWGGLEQGNACKHFYQGVIPVYPLIGWLWHLVSALEHWWHWLMGGESHLLLNHRHWSYYIQCNKAFPVCGIFTWRAEICLNFVHWGQDVFVIFPTGSGRP